MNSASTRVAKIIGYNILIIFVLVNLLYWSIPVFGALSRLYKTTVVETWFRAVPASYSSSEHDWVKRHWIELNRSQSVYKSYVGWRRAPFQGETMNVEGPYLQRRTTTEGASDAGKVFFFGGSTMWGLGSRDAETIPSYFAALTRTSAQNFGEDGWVAHQSLIMLIQLLQAGHRPDLVVFYDGVNDALQKCRVEITPEAHERERDFDRVLRRSLRPDSFGHFMSAVLVLAHRVHDQLGLSRGGQPSHDCDRNEQKAEAIADALIKDWQLAKQLVKAHGGKFVGILQPVSYFSRTRLDYLRLSAADKAQYEAVYPRIRERIAGAGEFHDLVALFDTDEPMYVDWCHVAPKGNRRIAEKIATIAGLSFWPDH